MNRNTLIAILIVSFSLLSCKVAGLERENIINGKLASDHQFPYMVWIGIGYGEYKQMKCGGTLITSNMVLTAAHCIYNLDTKDINDAPYVVVSRSINIYDRGHSIAVSKIYCHKLYNSSPLRYDIAMLRLEKRFPINSRSYIRPASLPSENENFIGKFTILMGFGKDNVTETIDPVTRNKIFTFSTNGKLKYTAITLMNSDYCSNITGVLCGRAQKSYSDLRRTACFGDSGSPLMYKNQVVGVLSFGTSDICALTQEIGFSKVSYFIDFIKGAINDQPTNNTLTKSIYGYVHITIPTKNYDITTKSPELINVLKNLKINHPKYFSMREECTKLDKHYNKGMNNYIEKVCSEADKLAEYTEMQIREVEYLRHTETYW